MAQILTAAGQRLPEIISSTCLEESTVTLSLDVTNYLQFKGMNVADYVSSRVFSVGGYDWEIRFYPQGINEDCAGNASVFVWHCGLLPAEDVRTRFSLSMLENKSQARVASFNVRKRVFTSRFNLWGYHKFVKKSTLESMSQLGDGCFTILCVLTVSHDSPAPPELSGHFERMLRDGTGTDVAFDVAGHEFRAHRALMAARSSVLDAQVFGPTAEKDMLRVEVVGVEPAIFRMMLHYIYTDSLPEYQGEGGGGYSVAAMHDLLGAASLYGLDRLKLMCEDELCKRIDHETITTTSALADEHRCKRLKVACDEFVSAAELWLPWWRPTGLKDKLLPNGF